MKHFKSLLALLIIPFFLLTACKKEPNTKILRYSTWGSQSEIRIIKPIIKEFEEKNNVKVELLHIPQNYFQKLHLLFASKQAPDVLFINNYYLPLYANAHLLEDLTPHFGTMFKKENYFQNTIDALTINEKTYAIPRDVSNIVVYFNKDFFDRKNIPYPNKKWTYNDFVNTAKLLTDNNVWGVGFDEKSIFWEPFLYSDGTQIFDKNGNFTLNSKQAKESIKRYIDLRTTYKVAPSQENSANRTMAQMFLDKKIAMQISGRWLVPKFREEADFDWDIITIPQGLIGSINSSDSSGWAISKSTDNKELALKFIQHLSSADSIAKMTSDGLITPARRDVAYSNIFLDNKKPYNAQAFLEANENAIIKAIPSDYNKKIEKLTNILEPYFSGKEKITPNTEFEL